MTNSKCPPRILLNLIASFFALLLFIPVLQSTPIYSTKEEIGTLVLTYPAQVRTGDSNFIHMTFDPGSGMQEIFETRHVIAEARFDVTGMKSVPIELVSQTLLEDQTVSFNWIVNPTRTGIYQGTVWLYLRFVDKVSGEESRETVSAQIVEIEAIDLMGLSARMVRILGVSGVTLGGVLIYPYLIELWGLSGRLKSRKEGDEYHKKN